MPTPIPNIWQLQSKGDIDGLIAALRHSEASARKGAAAALRVLGAWQAVPALEAALSVERDWQAHAAIMAALSYLDHDIHIETMIKNRDVRGLMKMLNSRKVEDLLIACEALTSLGDRQATEPLVMVFRNPMMPNNVRLAAAEALLKLESAPAVVTLIGALRREDWQVRRNAAAVLGQLQATWATAPLIKVLNDPVHAVQRTAAAALRRFGTPEALEAVANYEAALQKNPARTTLTDGDPDAELLSSTARPASTGPFKTPPPPPPAPIIITPPGDDVEPPPPLIVVHPPAPAPAPVLPTTLLKPSSGPLLPGTGPLLARLTAEVQAVRGVTAELNPPLPPVLPDDNANGAKTEPLAPPPDAKLTPPPDAGSTQGK